MGKRTTAIALCTVVLCGTSAAHAVQDTAGSGKPTANLVLQIEAEKREWSSLSTKGVSDLEDAPDTLRASSQYELLLPYAARIVGWEADGSAVYRYALADADGDAVTGAVYQSVKRQMQGGTSVWILTAKTKEGVQQHTVAAEDGSWVIGPYEADVLLEGNRIFVQRDGENWSGVYTMDGEKLCQVMGRVTSCSDGVIVSRSGTGADAKWYLTDASSGKQISALKELNVGAFDSGYAAVRQGENRCGIVDKAGTITELKDIVQLDDIQNGYALAQNSSGKYGVIAAETGKTALAFDYVRGSLCSESSPVYQLWTSDTQCVVKNAKSGQKVGVPTDLQGKALTALPDNYYTYVAADGSSVVFDDMCTIKLDANVSFETVGEDVVAVIGKGFFQLLNLKEGQVGKKIHLNAAPLSDLAAQSDQVFTVEHPDSGLQGIYHAREKTVLPARYDSITPVSGDHYMVRVGAWSGIVDDRGHWIVCTQIGAAD